MSKFVVTEKSVYISELQFNDSFCVELQDDSGASALFLYKVSNFDYSNFTISAGNIPGQFLGREFSGQITKISVALPEGDSVEKYLQDSQNLQNLQGVQDPPEEGRNLSITNADVEMTIEADTQSDPDTQFDTAPESVRISAYDAAFTLNGSFERQEAASEISGETEWAQPYCDYDPAGRILRLWGNFSFRESENAYSRPVDVSEVLALCVDESEWVKVRDEWTAAPGKALAIFGTEMDCFSGDDGAIVIISSDGSTKLSLEDTDGAETQAAVIFSKAAARHDVSVVLENDALVLQFTSPHILTTEDTVLRFGDGERLVITGFDGNSWDAAIKAGGIGGEFTIRGGTVQTNENGVHQISGTTEDPVQLEFPTASEMVLVQYDGQTAETADIPLVPLILGGALIVACAVIAVLAGRCRRAQKRLRKAGESARARENRENRENKDTDLFARQDESRPAALRVGKLQNIGKRSGQQDSMGVIPVQGGVFAVVADGMGGLSDGDKVSQKIVQTMLGDVNNHRADQIAGNMAQLVAHANSEVNQMLGFSNQYKSGSTLLAVVAEPGRFHWIAVGDSRIYLYRGGSIIQINHEHVFEAELITKAVNHELSFQEARGNKKKGSVTSFIGMGELRYIDMSLGPVLFVPGDKILLMSDGVFNTLSETELSRLLEANPDPAQAAMAIEAGVLSRNRPHQDNFSCIIIDYS